MSRRKTYIQSLAYPFSVDSSSVYVICSSKGVKIGHSSDVRKRAGSIQVGNSDRLFIYWAVRLTRTHALVIERRVKEHLKNLGDYLGGEWYSITPEKAKELISFFIKELGFKCCPDRDFGKESKDRYVGSLPKKKFSRRKTLEEDFSDRMRKEQIKLLFGGSAYIGKVFK